MLDHSIARIDLSFLSNGDTDFSSLDSKSYLMYTLYENERSNRHVLCGGTKQDYGDELYVRTKCNLIMQIGSCFCS